MGAWGLGNFENDDALDFAYEVSNSQSKELLLNVLNAIFAESDYLDAPVCTGALASAEVILAGLAKDFQRVPPEIKAWVLKKRGLFSKKEISFDKSDAELATKAIERILQSSELKELWEETDQYEEWKAVQMALVEGLNPHL